ncbi:hypothetical protein GALL_437190 [mine drainage metagenome]|uniref:Uncharacterized protein n=1 Tax=mine drainage metagenome TaxID=410659 RepID=A0A1J5Q3Z4_9ZZZZ
MLLFAAACFGHGLGGQFAFSLLVVFLARRSVVGLVLAFVAALLMDGPALGYGAFSVLCLSWVLWGPLPPAVALSRRFRWAFYPVHLAVLVVARAVMV